MLPSGSVAVAVTNPSPPPGCASVTEKEASPPGVVFTVVEPRNAEPSPCPDGSHAVPAKNSTR